MRRSVFAIVALRCACLAGATSAACSSMPRETADSGRGDGSADRLDGAPASGSGECGEGMGSGAFSYTATCSFPLDDAGTPTTCQEWSEAEDGDWTPFIQTCVESGGAIDAVPCPDAGLVGACALAPTCATQTTVFTYAPSTTAEAKASCASQAGAAFVTP